MKKTLAVFTAIAGVALCCAAAWAAEPKSKSETGILPAEEYRTPLDEIVVEGRAPYWKNETPRWDRAKVEAPKPDAADSSRMQWAPRYTRDERDDYNEPRDTSAQPQPRAKIFEMKF